MGDESIDLITEEDTFSIVKIQGREFKIGKIRPVYYLRLLKIISRVYARCIKEVQAMKVEFSKMSDIEAVASFISFLEEEEYFRVLAILLETDDLEFCSKIDQYELLDLLELFLKYNNLGLFIKKVQGVIKTASEQMKVINTNS